MTVYSLRCAEFPAPIIGRSTLIPTFTMLLICLLPGARASAQPNGAFDRNNLRILYAQDIVDSQDQQCLNPILHAVCSVSS
jgi:hypothetical protein